MPDFRKIKYKKVPSPDACTLLLSQYNVASSGDKEEIRNKADWLGCGWAKLPMQSSKNDKPPPIYTIDDPSWPEPDPHGPWWLGGVYDVEIVKDPV
jgi:hypothetical protein